MRTPIDDVDDDVLLPDLVRIHSCYALALQSSLCEGGQL
jgi:hypothetical protein